MAFRYSHKHSRIRDNRAPVGRLIEAAQPPLLDKAPENDNRKRRVKNPRLMKDEQFIEHLKGVMAEDGIRSRLEMKKSRPDLFGSLITRSSRRPGLIASTGLTMESGEWEVMTGREITDAAKIFIDTKNITSVPELRDANPGLYSNLCRMGCMESVIRYMRNKMVKSRSLVQPASKPAADETPSG
jgi:hypothetical protein